MTTEAGRQAALGSLLDCLRCDNREIPENVVPYRRTPLFTEDRVPEGLLQDHSTKPGTWGMIRVVSGRLDYILGEQTIELDPNTPGVVVPGQQHAVRPRGKVRFYVEFLRCP